MRIKIFGSGVALSVLLIVAEVTSPAPLFIWNKTESVQKGLYLQGSGRFERGDIVAVMPPTDVRILLTERNYLPETVPLLKRVAATQGDMICRKGETVFINGNSVATAQKVDSLQREMPIWAGCFTLNSDEFFLLNSHPKSLDGRYFGLTNGSHILGKYRLIYGVGEMEGSLNSDAAGEEYQAHRRAR